MRQKDLRLILLFVFLAIASVVYLGATDHYTVVGGPKNFYMGHISYSETGQGGKDPVVFREGQSSSEPAVVNLPLGPGDTVETSDGGRCEIQFDNGTIIRLDKNTRFKIETILAQSLSSQNLVTNLVLTRGQIYVMFKEYNKHELFQILTAESAVKLTHNTVARIKAVEGDFTDLQLETGKAKILYGPTEKKLKDQKIKAMEHWIITKDHQAKAGEYEAVGDFLAWNNLINEKFKEFHQASNLPKPIERYSLAVRNFAQKFGFHYGEWIWHDLYGYIWRPFFNDSYPNGTWAPYTFGQWTSLNDQMYWVPDEPWGWVPYHLGIWTWDEKKGWLWLPGSMFAPAWVYWSGLDNYYGWRPWSVWDWYGPSWFFYDYYYARNPGFPFYSWYFPFNDFNYQSFPHAGQGFAGIENGPYVNHPMPITTISKGQLKKKSDPTLPMPNEMKAVSKTLTEALLRGDKNALASLKAAREAIRLVKKDELKAGPIKNLIISKEKLANELKTLALKNTIFPVKETTAQKSQADRSSRDTYNQVVHVFQTHVGVSQDSERAASRRLIRISQSNYIRDIPVSKKGPYDRYRDPSPVARFRDHNPDSRIANRQGIPLSYSSQLNSVVTSNFHVANGSWGNGLSAGSRSGGWASGSSGSSGLSGGSRSGGSSSGSSGGSSGSSGGGGHVGGGSGGGSASGGGGGGGKK